MTDYKTFHEAGFLLDLYDYIAGADLTGKHNQIESIVNGAKDVFNGKGIKKKDDAVINTNIAKTASDFTCVFPVIVSKAIDIDKAVMISKAIERKAASMLQMLFSAYQISSAKDAKTYLRNFHHNLDSNIDWSGLDVDDLLNYTATEEEALIPPYLHDRVRAICEHVKRDIHYVLETELKNEPIYNYRVKENHNILNEQKFKSSNKTTTTKELSTQYFDVNEKKWKYRDQLSGVSDDDLKKYKQKQKTIETIDGQPGFGPRDLEGIGQYFNKQVLSNDIKKANEAQPTLMIVNFIYDKGDAADHISHSCVIGVKALIHYVDPEDIVNRVVLKKADNRGLFNFIRATTGEIAFFKDFLFAVDRAKIDAIAKSGKGSTNKIWKLLELRAERLRGAKVTRQDQANNAAISTLVISKAEVDYIKQYKRIDLSSPGMAKSILRGYNLMALVIIDDVVEKVDFLYDDGSNDFESLSFMSLEREEAGSMYKKVVNLAMKGR